MEFQTYVWLIFAILSIISAAMTIATSNPVHSVFYLIFTFVNVSALFFLLGVEFLAVIFLIVYVGAVSILFLFVVMMLNIKLVEWTESLTRFVPITLVIGLIFLSQATSLLDSFSNTNLLSTTKSLETPAAAAEGNLWLSVQFVDWVRSFINFTNAEILGQFLYTDFSYLFLLSSMVLLVAMIGAIILSLDHHRQIKRQDLYSQISTKSTINLKDTIKS